MTVARSTAAREIQEYAAACRFASIKTFGAMCPLLHYCIVESSRLLYGCAWGLLVGDSLTGEMFYTLAIILRAELLDDGSKGVVKFIGCHGRLTLSFSRNDFLDTRATEFPSELC